VKIVFREYVCQKWIDLRQTKTKMIKGSILHISSDTYYLRKSFVFVIFVCNYPVGPHRPWVTWPFTYLLLFFDPQYI